MAEYFYNSSQVDGNMVAINFDEPSEGRVASDRNALAVTNTGAGVSLWAHTERGEAVHGETNSTNFAALAGINLNPETLIAAVYGENRGKGPALWGVSRGHEGVHGETRSDRFAAVAGIQLNENPTEFPAGVYGESRGKGAATVGICKKDGAGIWGVSQQGEGVHGETRSDRFAAVAGIQLNNTTNNNAVGMFGASQRGEGVHGETRSDRFAAVAGLQLNPNSFAAGIFGRGKIAGRFEGDVEVTGDIRLLGADCAEEFDISGGYKIESGTVMVLSSSEGGLEPSSRAYDKKVAGVVSGAGGFEPGIVLDKKQLRESKEKNKKKRMPIALMGKVYCKVDASYSPVEVGDLLTTSATRGHAMKASDPIQAFGSIIGKALRSIKKGKGLIPILVTLQ
jgi:hypothetical protein